MSTNAPFVTYLELRESTADGELGAGLSHSSAGLVLLHVLELAATGEPRGAVTVVHEAGGHGARYVELAHRLAGDGWAVALPDLRGHGRSEGERGHSNGVKEVLRDLGDVQDHLAYRQPDAPKVLVGHGLGAVWCLAYALDKPDGVSALVLANPLLEPRFDLPQVGGWKKLFNKVTPRTPGKLGFPTPKDELAHDVITLRAGEQALETAHASAARIGDLSMPVLVLVSARDEVAPPAKALSLRGPRVTVQEIADARHELFHGAHASAAFDAITRWLATQLPR